MKFLNFLKNFFNLKKNPIEPVDTQEEHFFIKEDEEEVIKEEDSLIECTDYAKLQLKKYKALNECINCDKEVFVLIKDGVEIDYQPNLNKLATENGLRPTNVYRYFKNQTPDKKLLLGRYDIIRYSSI